VKKGSRFDPDKWQGKMYRARYWNDAYFRALDIVKPVAEKHGMTMAEVALRWMTHHSLLENNIRMLYSSTRVVQSTLIKI